MTHKEALHRIALLLPPTLTAPQPRLPASEDYLQKRLYEAVQVAREAAPDFLESLPGAVIDRPQTREWGCKPCGACDGTGAVDEKDDCRRCDGSGSIVVEG